MIIRQSSVLGKKGKQEEEMGKHVDNGRTKVVRADEEEEEEEEERSRKKRKWCEEVKEGEACGAKYERKEVEEEKELCGDADLEKRKRQEEARTGEEQEVGSDGKQ